MSWKKKLTKLAETVGDAADTVSDKVGEAAEMAREKVRSASDTRAESARASAVEGLWRARDHLAVVPEDWEPEDAGNRKEAAFRINAALELLGEISGAKNESD